MAPTARHVAALAAFLALATALSGCGKDADPMADGKVQVATSTAPITSLVSNIGGPYVRVTGIVPEQRNAHTYEPGKAARRSLAAADLVFLNGLGLDASTEDLANDAKRSGVEVVKLGDEAVADDDRIYDATYPKADGQPNPHAWLDPVLAKAYVAEITDRLVDLDGKHAKAFRENEKALVAKIDALDDAAKTATDSIPKANRKVLAYHDAFGYLARRYGLTVLPAVQPASLRQPTAKDLAAARKEIAKRKVPAAFGSAEFPSEGFAQMAAKARVPSVELRDDDLPGAPDEPGHSWLGLAQFDLVSMVEALGGNPAPLQAVDTQDVGPTKATYPQ